MNKIYLIVVILLFSIQSDAQSIFGVGPSPEEAKAIKISEATKLKVMKNLKSRIKEAYITKENVPELIKQLEEKIASNGYKEYTNALSFSRAVTKDLRNITNDSHFNLLYNPPFSKQIGQMMQAQAAGSTEAGNRQRQTSSSSNQRTARQPQITSKDGKVNYYFRKLEILDGNIGYVKIEQIPRINEARKTVDSAMGFLANSDALIIDLRNNRGGFGGFISYFMSYFFPSDKKLLFSRELSIGETQRFFTEVTLHNKRLDKIPIYILINERTGSAATNLTYTLQKHERARVVGVTTGKGKLGAHSAGPFPIADGFLATIPIGKVVHAKTKSNWNMTGVVPDIPTKEDAKEVAYQAALKAVK